jgi:riboflavin kinase/FMN adenylyltransferase
MGNFDGVHLGHQAIINNAVERAAALGGLSLALTFEPHPVRVLRPGPPLPLLTPFPLKVRLLERSGVERVVCAKFTPAFAEQSPADFVHKVLVDRLRVAEVCVGENFSFGKDRAGRPALLQELGRSAGFVVHVQPSIVVEGQVVSSSTIRQRIEEGAVAEAARLLGRPYLLLGDVVSGRGRGERLGFPTANLRHADQLLPADGVYAGWAAVGASPARYRGAVNVGTRPTFGEAERLVEVHLLDYPGSGALYGQTLELAFVARIRSERTFASGEALTTQITQDVAAIRMELARHAATRGGAGSAV